MQRKEKNMSQGSALEKPGTSEVSFKDEELEDYLDYCAAAEAIEEALKTGEIRPFEEFAKELGI
jgi:dihydroneopterin aldolase